MRTNFKLTVIRFFEVNIRANTYPKTHIYTCMHTISSDGSSFVRSFSGRTIIKILFDHFQIVNSVHQVNSVHHLISTNFFIY